MKKIVTITGHKHTKKDTIAKKLASNSDVEYVTPYTDKEIPKWIDSEKVDEHHHVTAEELDEMIENEKVLSITKINDTRYVFFEFQFMYPYSVVIADDYAVVDIKKNWDGKIFTIRTVSRNEEQSERVGEYLFKHEFDAVFDYEYDDYDELEILIT